jgi:hypothetical protein
MRLGAAAVVRVVPLFAGVFAGAFLAGAFLAGVRVAVVLGVVTAAV